MSELIADRYRIDLVLQEDKSVYPAFDQHLNRTVAIKIWPKNRPEASAAKQFYREAAEAARLSHPNVVAIYDVGEHSAFRGREAKRPAPFLVMEYVPGRSLSHYLAERQPPAVDDISDPVRRKLDLLVHVCRGLHYGHEHGLVHGALTPDNILVMFAEEVKILNFGITPIRDASVRYMSPEQLQEGRVVDRRSDVFTLGIVLSEVLLGVHPFNAETEEAIRSRICTGDRSPVEELLPGWASELCMILQSSLAGNPDDRFPDCRSVEAALRRFRNHLPEDRQERHEGLLSVEELIKSAEVAGYEGRVEPALALLAGVLKADPGNEQARALESAVKARKESAGLIEEAGAAEAGGDAAMASILALQALQLDPHSSEAEMLFERNREALRHRDEQDSPGLPSPAVSGVESTKVLPAGETGAPSEVPGIGSEEADQAELPWYDWPSDQEDSDSETQTSWFTSVWRRSPGFRVSRVIVPILGVLLLAGAIWFFSVGRDRGPVPVSADPVAQQSSPAKAAPGTVSLDILPWARVDSIVNLKDGREVPHARLETPCTFSLPAGKYALTVSHPEFGARMLTVEVASGRASTVQQSLLSQQQLDELFSGGR